MKPNNNAVLSPNLGLYYNKSELLIAKRALSDGYNFRIKDGKLNNYNLGRTKFGTWVLDGRGMKVYTHTDRASGDTLFFADPTDIYKYLPAGLGSIVYMTPRYEVGTVAVAGTAVTGTASVWLTNTKAGDKISFGGTGINVQAPSANDSFTKILLHMDGVDATTTFLDHNDGGSAHVWTASGNAQIDTADFKFGGASGLFDGVLDNINTPDSVNYTLGSGDWTVRMQFKCTAAASGGTVQSLYGQGNNAILATTVSINAYRNPANKIQAFAYVGGVATSVTSTSTFTNAVNTGWHHLEVCRSGNILRMFIDGVQEGGDVALTGTINDSANLFSVGAVGEYTGETWTGWLDEFALDVGVARHTANFTPPTRENDTGWFTIQTVNNDLSLTLTGTALNIAAGSAYTIRKTYITGLPDQWQFTTFLNDGVDGKDRMFATNGVDWVQTWAFGDTQMTPQSGMAFKCKAIRPFSNMMIYANLTAPTLLPTSMINSDVGLPTHAGTLGTGLSEQFIVHDGVDGVDSLGILANSLVFYAEKHIVGAQFVGDPEVFAFRKIDREVGPCGPFAVAEFGDYHEFLGPDGAYRFDGVGASETNSHVMRYVRANMDPMRKRFVFTHFVDVEGEVLWSVPGVTDAGSGTLGTAPVTAYCEHYLEEVGPQTPRPFSKRSFPFTATGYWTNNTPLIWSSMNLTWANYASRWSDQGNAVAAIQQIALDVNGQAWIFNNAQQANGLNLASFVQFPRFATGDMHEKNRIQRCYPYVTPGIGLIDVTTLTTNFVTGTLSSDPSLSFNTALTGDDFVSPMAKARFGAFRFGSSTGAFQIEGYNYDVAEMAGGTR